MEKEKNIVANRIKTPDGTILWSRFRHDYVAYKDEKTGETYVVDGGTEYLRGSINEVKAESLVVYDDDPYEVQREVILRGTFNDKERIFVPLSKLSDDHLRAIIRYNNECCVFPPSVANRIYEQELEYRKEHGIEIPEHDYTPEAVESITKDTK